LLDLWDRVPEKGNLKTRLVQIALLTGDDKKADLFKRFTQLAGVSSVFVESCDEDTGLHPVQSGIAKSRAELRQEMALRTGAECYL
jgi:hypothetical protein